MQQSSDKFAQAASKDSIDLPPDAPCRSAGALLGIGVAMIEISRMQRILDRRPQSLARWFSHEEISRTARSPRSSEDFTGRLACKMAVRKAWADAARCTETTLNLRDVILTKDVHGRPVATLASPPSGMMSAACDSVWSLDVSITHSRDLAAAIAVFAVQSAARPDEPGEQ